MNNWVNNGKAGDLRRHPAHYDVTVMWLNDDNLSSTQSPNTELISMVLSSFFKIVGFVPQFICLFFTCNETIKEIRDWIRPSKF